MINSIGKSYSNVPNVYGFGNYVNYNDYPAGKNLNRIQEVTESEKISFAEGAELIAKGVGKQVSDIITTVFKHPGKTLLAIGTTTLGLMALPLVGIPTAVGGAVLAIGFAGLSIGKAIHHTAEFSKNNKAGDYEKARENLEQIGGDTVDLALSAPFIPKGIKHIKQFSKYGKIGINHEAIANIKSAKGLKGKFGELKTLGKNVEKSINFREITDSELAKLNGVTDAEKARIRQYIEDYNVPHEKIPEVVLEQWAKERGISAKPQVNFAATKKYTLGSANPQEGTIIIKDFSKPDLPPSTSGQISSEWKSVNSRLINSNTYEVTYKNTRTGQFRTDYLDKAINDARTNLLNETRNLSPEAQMIDTIIHEREHIDQFAKIYKMGEKFKGTTPTREAAQMYQQMANDMAPLTAAEKAKYHAMATYNKQGTRATYIMEPCEIAAREAEAKLLTRKEFRILDEVFKETAKVPPVNNKSEIILNNIRTQSAIS